MKRILLVISFVACSGLFNISRGQSPVDAAKAQNIRRLMEVTGSHQFAGHPVDQLMAALKKNTAADRPEIRDND